MNVAAERRREDFVRLQAMCAASNGRLRVLEHSGDPPHEITIELACRTASSESYPSRVLERVRARIRFPHRYPFQEPLVELEPAVFHPNVYLSGRVCFGYKWLPTEGLDLLVRRIARIVTFDPLLLNTNSPANPAAAVWYLKTSTTSPSVFPTDSLIFLTSTPERPAVQWNDLTVVPASAAKILPCVNCTRTLRVPDRPGAQVRCPACRQVFCVS